MQMTLIFQNLCYLLALNWLQVVEPLNTQHWHMAIWPRHSGKKLTSVSLLPHPVRYHFLDRSALIEISGADFPSLITADPESSDHIHPCQSQPHPNPISTLLWVNFTNTEFLTPNIVMFLSSVPFSKLYPACWESPHILS